MIRSNRQPRSGSFSRPALGMALAIGLLSGSALVAPAQAANAPKVTLSKTFQPLAVNLNKAIDAAKTRADVVAARANVASAQTALSQARGAARTQAQAGLDAAVAALGATLAAEKAQLDAAFTAATSADDRYMAGNFAIALGDLSKDTRIQRRGIEAMLASGKVLPADAPRLQYYVGQFAFDQLADDDRANLLDALHDILAGLGKLVMSFQRRQHSFQ